MQTMMAPSAAQSGKLSAPAADVLCCLLTHPIQGMLAECTPWCTPLGVRRQHTTSRKYPIGHYTPAGALLLGLARCSLHFAPWGPFRSQHPADWGGAQSVDGT